MSHTYLNRTYKTNANDGENLFSGLCIHRMTNAFFSPCRYTSEAEAASKPNFFLFLFSFHIWVSSSQQWSIDQAARRRDSGTNPSPLIWSKKISLQKATAKWSIAGEVGFKFNSEKCGKSRDFVTFLIRILGNSFVTAGGRKPITAY